MLKIILKAIFIITSVFMIACTSGEIETHFYQPHIGKWSSKDPEDKKATLILKEDGTGSIAFGNNINNFSYIIDYTKNPLWLDLIYIRNGKPFRAKLIVKFLDNNEMKLRSFFNEQRPKKFLEKDPKRALILKRDLTTEN